MNLIKEIDVKSLKNKLDNNENLTLIYVRENQELQIC